MRVLGVVRLSRSDPSSTSIERQTEAIQEYANRCGHTVVDIAVDEGVSGDVPPWERPGLGPYLPRSLASRGAKETPSMAGVWEGIVVWQIDRLSRRVADILTVIDWANKTGRSVFDTGGIEYTGPAGTLIVSVMGALAQSERERMTVRAKASRKKLAQKGAYPGGRVPYGYRPDGAGRLTFHETNAATARWIVDQLLNGESIYQVVKRLNEQQTPTPTGLVGRWSHAVVSKMVAGNSLAGHTVHRGVTVLSEDGTPVLRGPQIASTEELVKIRKLTSQRAKREFGPHGPRKGRRLLVGGVMICGECLTAGVVSNIVTERSTGTHRTVHYTCRNRRGVRDRECNNTWINAEEADQQIAGLILGAWGQTEMLTPVWDVGNDGTLYAELTETLKTMREDRAAGLYAGPDGAAEYRATYLRIEQQRAATAGPIRPAGVTHKPTGNTVADTWNASNSDDTKREMLTALGVRFALYREPTDGSRIHVAIPPGAATDLATIQTRLATLRT